ncbi:MAG: hypothetical protein RR835_03930 [Peptostreptococcaceae bacterium]
MKFGNCRIKSGASKNLNKILGFGRGKQYEYKFLSENKVLVYKKGTVFLVSDEDLVKYFELIK